MRLNVDFLVDFEVWKREKRHLLADVRPYVLSGGGMVDFEAF